MSTPSPKGAASHPASPADAALTSWVHEYARLIEGVRAIAETARALARAIRDGFRVEALAWVFEGSRAGEGVISRVVGLVKKLDRLLYPLRLPFNATMYEFYQLLYEGTPPERLLDAEFVAKLKSWPFRGDRTATTYGFASVAGSPSAAIEYIKTSPAVPQQLHDALAALMACHDELLRHYQWGPRVAGPNKAWPCTWPDAPPVPQSRLKALGKAARRLNNLAAAEIVKIEHYKAESRSRTEETVSRSTPAAPNRADHRLKEVRHAHGSPDRGGAGSNSIRRTAAIWEVCYGAESGGFPVADYSALEVVAKLVARPQEDVALADLVDPALRPSIEQTESATEVLDNPAVADLKRRYEELNRDASGEEDALVRAENEAELTSIAAELKRALGPSGRKRKLGQTAADQAWDALTKGLRRLWPRLRAAGMPELAAHLKNTIPTDRRPHVGYHPPASALPWVVS
jgi:hypothetical protein